MKKLQNLVLMAMFFCPFFLFAQIENTPCTAICLSLSGTMAATTPPADGLSPNNNFPCGGGTSEDNPTWFTFIAAKTVFDLSFSVGTCASGSSIQVTIWEGNSCDLLQALECRNCAMVADSFDVATIPGHQYWIQVDGCAEAICTYTLNYDPNQLLANTTPAPIVQGKTSLCKGLEQEYTASFTNGLQAESYTWSVLPASGGQITAISNGKVKVKWNNGGNFKLCALPKFSSICSVINTVTGCLDVVVNATLKDAICTQTLCAEQNLTSVDLASCIKAANLTFTGKLNPTTVIINQNPESTKTYSIQFGIDSTACVASATLTATLLPALKTVQTTTAVYVNEKRTVDLKKIMLQTNPTFVGSITPATLIINEPKLGKYLKKIKYKTDANGCNGDINLYVWVLKKYNTLVEGSPEVFKVAKVGTDMSIDHNNKKELKIYPNPSNGVFQLDVSSLKEPFEIEVFDNAGKLILQDKNTEVIDLEAFSNGTYLLKIKSAQGNETMKLNKI